MPEEPRVDARGVENVVALQTTDNAIRMECLEAHNAVPGKGRVSNCQHLHSRKRG